ncbi:MAG: hypothetical protein V3R83_12395 [Gammaproteobacteria bacterium]
MNKSKHGGARAGAGRKPDYPAGVETLYIKERLLATLVRGLDALAAHQKIERRQLLVNMITRALKREGF